MSETNNSKDLEWLEEFQLLANDQLIEGSACDQVHPLIEDWLDELLDGGPPDSRDSVWQATSCLTSEIMYKMTPENILEKLQQDFSEDEVATWLESIVLIGRAFQMALDNGRLDDL